MAGLTSTRNSLFFLLAYGMLHRCMKLTFSAAHFPCSGHLGKCHEQYHTVRELHHRMGDFQFTQLCSACQHQYLALQLFTQRRLLASSGYLMSDRDKHQFRSNDMSIDHEQCAVQQHTTSDGPTTDNSPDEYYSTDTGKESTRRAVSQKNGKKLSS